MASQIPPNTFHRFPELPTKVRRHIWKLYRPVRYLRPVRTTIRPGIERVVLHYPQAGLLAISRESRDLALEAYDKDTLLNADEVTPTTQLLCHGTRTSTRTSTHGTTVFLSNRSSRLLWYSHDPFAVTAGSTMWCKPTRLVIYEALLPRVNENRIRNSLDELIIVVGSAVRYTRVMDMQLGDSWKLGLLSWGAGDSISRFRRWFWLNVLLLRLDILKDEGKEVPAVKVMELYPGDLGRLTLHDEENNLWGLGPSRPLSLKERNGYPAWEAWLEAQQSN